MRYEVDEGHPLLTLNPEPIQNWAVWKALWSQAHYIEQYLGLLHCGFQVPASNSGGNTWTAACIDRLCFYLDLADGHTSHHWFLSSEEKSRCIEDLSSRRSELSRKAFSALANGFFNDTSERAHDLPSWTALATEAGALEKLIWFFLRTDNIRDRDQPSKVPVERATKFVFELCKIGMSKAYERGTGYFDDARLERLRAARPDFVEILFKIGQGHTLLDRETYPLNDISWDRLNQLALAERTLRVPNTQGYGTVYETRAPKTIAEAIANGSHEARILLILEAAKAEDARLREAVEAREVKRQADLRLAQTEYA